MRVKQHLLASALCVLPFAACAADMPVKAPRLMPAPFTWTGFYLGFTVGGLDPLTKDAFIDTTPRAAWFGNLSGDTTSLTGGVTAGFNYQVSSIVLGVEADYSLANNTQNMASKTTGNFNLIGTRTFNNWGTVRGRLGLAFDHALVYGTGGVVFADVKGSTNFFNPSDSGCNASFSQTRSGWTAGGGVEYYFTNYVSAKGEVLYGDLGTVTAMSPLGCTTTFKNTFTVGRAGLNFKF